MVQLGDDVLEISADDPEAFKDLQKDLKLVEKAPKPKILSKSKSSRNVQLVIQHCGCENAPAPVSPVFEKNNCLELQPAIYKGGWEYYRVISFSEKDMRSLRDPGAILQGRGHLAASNADGGRRGDDASLDDGAFRRSDEEAGVIPCLALENGYYQIPKKVTTEEMANKLRLPRTTDEEHLRKAEGKVLRSMAPYINLTPT